MVNVNSRSPRPVTNETGVLMSDPYVLDAFGDAVADLLDDQDRACTLGDAGH